MAREQNRPGAAAPAPPPTTAPTLKAGVAAVGLDLYCTNPDCSDCGKVIETVTLDEIEVPADGSLPEGGKLKVETAETFECDKCDRVYSIPTVKILF